MSDLTFVGIVPLSDFGSLMRCIVLVCGNQLKAYRSFQKKCSSIENISLMALLISRTAKIISQSAAVHFVGGSNHFLMLNFTLTQKYSSINYN